MKLISRMLRQAAFFALAWGMVIGSRADDLPARFSDVAAMRADEAKDGLPITPFFSGDGKSGPDGQLIRSEPATEYELPQGARATRILYRSRDLRGAPTTASATVVTPSGQPPSGGWPLLIWAHGTTGVARQCAPSTTKSLGYYVPELLQQGFAVVAVDYAGMATDNGGTEYLTKTSNALDTINAVPAAQAAVQQLTRKWVAIGHSQGGLAVWGVAELEAKRKDPNYLGGVALAPAVGGVPLIRNSGERKGNTFYPVYVAYAVKRLFPDFQVNDFLTPAAAAHYDELTKSSCFFVAYASFSSIAPGQVLKKNWDDNSYFKQFMALNRVGAEPVRGPLFIASGKEDDSVPSGLIEGAVKLQCKAGGRLSYQTYAGDHSSMMRSSFKDQMSWIKDRFGEKPAAGSGCP
jgi:pimeloyl-ACP methyl ester carboxylesterase